MSEPIQGRVVSAASAENPTARQGWDYHRFLMRTYLPWWQYVPRIALGWFGYAAWCVRDWFR